MCPCYSNNNNNKQFSITYINLLIRFNNFVAISVNSLSIGSQNQQSKPLLSYHHGEIKYQKIRLSERISKSKIFYKAVRFKSCVISNAIFPELLNQIKRHFRIILFTYSVNYSHNNNYFLLNNESTGAPKLNH